MTVDVFFIVCLFIAIFAIGLFIGYLIGLFIGYLIGFGSERGIH
jgi:hypothetical protein